jgi:hypothetical protein
MIAATTRHAESAAKVQLLLEARADPAAPFLMQSGSSAKVRAGAERRSTAALVSCVGPIRADPGRPR